MKKYLLSLLGLTLLFGGLLFSADKQATSDKARISALEAKVEALQMDLAGEHEWADTVNQATQVLDARTLDLNSRLIKVEGRGPVARNQ